jgi:hypothetical protein
MSLIQQQLRHLLWQFRIVFVCVTNSSGPPSKLFKDTPAGSVARCRRTTLLSTIYFAKETLPRMQRQTRSLV